jgi:hypothetical protein
MHWRHSGHRRAMGGRITRRSVGVLAAGLAAAALTLPGAGAVRADTQVAGGGLVVTVTANLPSFPCASCTSTASGTGTGVVAGVDVTTKSKAAAVFKLAAYSTSFSYHEACPSALAGKPVTPPEGFASGTYVLGPGTMVGAAGPAFLTGNFNYTRVGLTAVITTTGNQLHSGSSTGPTVGPAALGASVGIFIPEKTPGNCASPSPAPPATIGVDSVAVAAA